MTELPAHQHALAHRERQVRKGKLAVLLAVAGGIATLVGGGLAIEDPALGPVLAALGGVAALALGALAATRVLATVRYRISTPNAAGWLAVKIAAGVGLFATVAAVADALEAPTASRRVLVAVLVAGFGWLVADHAARTTLFQADATGVRFGRSTVPWPTIGQFVVATGARPGTAEIGLRPVAGAQCPNRPPVPGAVLAELPLSTVVEAAKLDQARLTWAIAQSGRTDIDLVIHGGTPPAGEPAENPTTATTPTPLPQGTAGPRDRRVWWAAAGIGLVGALVATAVIVGGSTTVSGSPVSVSGSPDARYSAASVDKACDVVDVYVLKEWSTEPRIATEQDVFELGEGDVLSCSAFSDVQYTAGRYVTLNLEVTVAADEAAATAEYRDPANPDFWSVDGDVTEHGTVPELGTAAEYKSSIRTFGDTTRTTYALRLQDGNLALLMRFQSDVDQTDGTGVGIDTLADTAAVQAGAAMRKLRDAPAGQPHKSDPGQVPATVGAAAKAKTTGPLMARVRGVDPCALLDRKLPSEFGVPQVVPKQAQAFDECELAAGEAEFSIDVVEPLTKEERAELTEDEVAGRVTFYGAGEFETDGCAYYLPYETTGFGARIDVAQPGSGENADPCATAKKYATQLAPTVEKLPERTTPAPEPTLVGKDPCVIADDFMSTLDGWERGPVSRPDSVACQFDISQGEESYEIALDFDRDAEQIGDEPVTIGGLSGVRFPSPDIGQCMVSLVYVPETTPDAWDAQNIGVSILRDNSVSTNAALDPCAVTTTAAELLISSV